MRSVLIIGGGAVGLCCAYFLAKQGRKVTLLEKDHLGAGSSSGNAGWIAVRHAEPQAVPGVITQGLKWLLDPGSPFHIRLRPDPGLLRWLLQFQKNANRGQMLRTIPILLDLNRRSNAIFQDWAASGLDFGYQQKGLLHIFRSEKGFAHGREQAGLLAQFGLESEFFGPEAIADFEPAVNPGTAGGIFYPEPGHLDPLVFVRRLEKIVRGLGVDLQTGVSVTGFHQAGGRLAAVRTSEGEISAGLVVLAAGAWSAPLAKLAGEELLLQPAKGYSFSAPLPAHPPLRPLSLEEAKVAVTPMGSTLRFSSTLDLAGFDPSFNQKRLAATRSALGRYLAGMENLEPGEPWYGYRPLTPDSLPIIRYSRRLENLIYATGHGMLGITQAPETGRLVAKLAAGE